MSSKTIDRPFLILTITLVLAGIFIFSSASLGLLAREGITFAGVATNQAFGLLLGIVLLVIATRIPYQFWNRYALYILLGGILLTLLVFVPELGFSHGGATRWLTLGSFSFQPAEVLKLGFVVYFAAWLSGARHRLGTIRYGILPLAILLVIIGGILILQPDIGTFLVIAATGVVMFIAAGGKWRHIFSFGAVALGGLGILALILPYIKTRLLTFINPALDPLGAGYQIQQSLIAIGSGKFFGRGFGQSVQKFNFLPEPVGDSIFAVFAEEWGFVGAVILVIAFVLFSLRGYKIASGAPTYFSGLLATGLVTIIIVQSFINIAAMLGVFPLTGEPLIFVSQGGSALMLALLEVGIVLGISKTSR
ncbi:putative lipid II flippase FtsW [Candidatus Wolfebacteria bacterium]|nr:putative lipid II flippase FtsW [Candidatus Wolfebacteria bacterium]